VTIDSNDSHINWVWNGSLSEEGGNYVVDAKWYNSALDPGATTSFSFCASKTGPDYVPEVISAVAE
jgi:hypothetical protein